MDSYTSYRSSQKVCTELRARCVAEGVVATHAEAIRRFPLNVSAPVINHHIDTMQGLLGRRAASREETVTPGRALYWAARQGHEQIVGRLLAAGADANQEHALYWAARNGHEQIVGRLLAAGADANQEQALYWAAREGHEQIVDRLLAARADANQEHALYWAAREGHEQIVDRLLAAGADANQEHALYWAAREGHEQIVERLLVAGATGTDGMSTPRMRQLQAAVSAARSIRRKQLSLSEFNRPSVLDALPSEIVTDRIFPFV